MRQLKWTAVRGVFLSAITSTLACLAAAHEPPAFRLGDVASPRSYEAQLTVDPLAETFSAQLRIYLVFKRATPILWLNGTNLTIESAQFEQGARKVAAKLVDGGEDFVGFEAEGEPFAAGPAIATIRYRAPIDGGSSRGIFRQKNADEWYVISQFEALSARRAFPCFDEPGWKTPWQLTIDAPARNVVVSNTPETLAFDLPDRAGWKRHAFAATKPLPSYLVALAVGPFDIVDGGTAGARKTPLRYVVPKGRGADVRYAREATPRILELLEAYFGIPYPFEKLDSVVVPQFGGAMENAGMITYDTSWLLAKPHEESDNQRRRYTSIAAHEIAHHWFGDYMTLAWWEDIWLNEAFATWMAEKILYQFDPKWDNGLNHAWFRSSAIEADRLASARRVKNPVASKDDVHAAFDNITYNKGAEVLGMFETWLGPEKFRAGVRTFLERHAWASATSADFFRAIGEASGRRDDAMKAFANFIEQPGVPLVLAVLQCDDNYAQLDLFQQRLRPVGSTMPPMKWLMPACFRYSVQGKLETQCMEIVGGKSTEVLATRVCPEWIAGNARGVGHYVTRYDAPTARRLTSRFASLPVHEANALVGDMKLLAESGLVTIEEALAWAEAGLGHPSPIVQYPAVVLLEKQRDEWLDAAQARRKREIVAARVVPLATRVGWRAKPDDGIEVIRLRSVLLPFAAQTAEGQSLRPEARAMALAWLADRSAIAVDIVQGALDTAARFADAATFDKLEAAAFAIDDTRDRRFLLGALGKARDERLRERALAIALAKQDGNDRLNGYNALDLLHYTFDDDASRAPAFDYFRANFEPLVAKLPKDSPAWLMESMGQLCTRASRDAFAEFFATRASRFVGGPNHYRQALETIDLCLAARGL